MREPLWIFRRRFGADKVTRPFLPIFKAYLYILLEGLDYLHSECRVIHTGQHKDVFRLLRPTKLLSRSEVG